jgi:hypothetical protein
MPEVPITAAVTAIDSKAALANADAVKTALLTLAETG